MAKVILCLVLCLTAVLCNPSGTSKSYFKEGRGNAKLKGIQEATKALAALVRSVECKDPLSKLKVVDMANELVHATQTAVYNLNQGIPSIKDQDLRKGFIDIVESLSKLADRVQHHIHGDSDTLKNCLADSLEKVCDVARKISIILDKNDCKGERFIGNQLRKSINQVMFAASKIKYEVNLITKTNKELEPEIDGAVEGLCTALKNIKDDDLEAKEELLHLIQHLERSQELAVIKLENYVDINTETDKNIAIVKEVAKGLSDSCDDLHKLSWGDKDVAQLKTDFEKEYREAVNWIKKLVDCDISENTAGELYLRSVIFDTFTLAKGYEYELNNLHKTV